MFNAYSLHSVSATSFQISLLNYIKLFKHKHFITKNYIFTFNLNHFAIISKSKSTKRAQKHYTATQ